MFPDATVQTCIVHLLRHSLDLFVGLTRSHRDHGPSSPYKDRKAVAAALKDIYRSVDAAAGEAALATFDEGLWGRRYPAIGQSWRRAWTEVVPFYAFPSDVHRILYTTNAIEALNAKLRRAVRARGHFPTDEAAMKLLFLVLNRAEREWKMPPREWSMSASLTSLRGIGQRPMAKAQFAVLFGERFTRAYGRLMGNRPPPHEISDGPEQVLSTCCPVLNYPEPTEQLCVKLKTLLLRDRDIDQLH